MYVYVMHSMQVNFYAFYFILTCTKEYTAGAAGLIVYRFFHNWKSNLWLSMYMYVHVSTLYLDSRCKLQLFFAETKAALK